MSWTRRQLQKPLSSTQLILRTLPISPHPFCRLDRSPCPFHPRKIFLGLVSDSGSLWGRLRIECPGSDCWLYRKARIAKILHGYKVRPRAIINNTKSQWHILAFWNELFEHRISCNRKETYLVVASNSKFATLPALYVAAKGLLFGLAYFPVFM